MVAEKAVSDDQRFFTFYTLEEFTAILADNKFSVVRSYKRKFKPEDKTVWLVYFVRA